MTVKKLHSQPARNAEFGQFTRKVIKVSPPPATDPFSDVYESEIEVRDDNTIDDTLDGEEKKGNDSLNEINDLIDSISNTTPQGRSSGGLNSITVRQLSGPEEESKESPQEPARRPAYTKKLTDIFDYCVQELEESQD